MLEFGLLLWLVDVLAGLGKLTKGLSIISGVAVFAILFIYMVSTDIDARTKEEQDEFRLRTAKAVVGAIITCIILSLITVIIPSRDTMNTMIGLHAADTVLELESTQKALGEMGDLAIKGSSVINKLLDQYLEEPVDAEVTSD